MKGITRGLSAQSTITGTPMSAPEREKEITVVVHAPRHKEAKSFRWPPSTTVGEAAKEAASAFGYAPNGNPTFMTSDGDVLDRSKTLAEERVKSGDKLELVDSGGGVLVALLGSGE